MSLYGVSFVPILFLIVLLAVNRKRTEEYIKAKINRKNGDEQMQELAKRLIGKDILANTVASGTVDGILKEIVDNTIVIEKKGKETFVNLDYVIRLREYPTAKNGKRKQIVLD